MLGRRCLSGCCNCAVNNVTHVIIIYNNITTNLITFFFFLFFFLQEVKTEVLRDKARRPASYLHPAFTSCHPQYNSWMCERRVAEEAEHPQDINVFHVLRIRETDGRRGDNDGKPRRHLRSKPACFYCVLFYFFIFFISSGSRSPRVGSAHLTVIKKGGRRLSPLTGMPRLSTGFC